MGKRQVQAESSITSKPGTGNLTHFSELEEGRKKLYKAASDLGRLKKNRLQRVNREYVGLFPTCTWDLETSNLNASIGFLLCAVIKPWGRPPIVLRIDDSPRYEKDRSNDQWLAKQIKATLEEFNVAVAYNGQRFDVPFLNTRLMLAGVRPIVSTVKHLDPLYASRFRLRLHSNRLETLVETFGLRHKKTPLNGNTWIQAATGMKKAMDTVVDHCVKDAYALEEITKILIQLMDLKFFLIR